MSINPVPSILPTPDPTAGDANVRPPTTSAPGSAGNEPGHPDSGQAPNPEHHSPPLSSTQTDLPDDEVQVQRDSTTEEIVIKYVDRSGNVILQMPSSQVLDVARGIDQNLQQEAKNETSRTGVQDQGDKTYGH